MAKYLTESVVDAAGHPTPGPWRFCNVIMLATIRAALEVFELSVGNEKGTAVLLTALPAATFSLSNCATGQQKWILIERYCYFNECDPIGWARARHLDDLSLRIRYPVAIAVPVRIQTSLATQVWNQRCIHQGNLTSRSRGACSCSGGSGF